MIRLMKTNWLALLLILTAERHDNADVQRRRWQLSRFGQLLARRSAARRIRGPESVRLHHQPEQRGQTRQRRIATRPASAGLFVFRLVLFFELRGRIVARRLSSNVLDVVIRLWCSQRLENVALAGRKTERCVGGDVSSEPGGWLGRRSGPFVISSRIGRRLNDSCDGV